MFKIDNTTKVDFFHSVSVKGIKSECKEKKPVESPSFGSKASSDAILKMVFALPRFPPLSLSLFTKKWEKKGRRRRMKMEKKESRSRSKRKPEYAGYPAVFTSFLGWRNLD
jgi:hypothetical protein